MVNGPHLLPRTPKMPIRAIAQINRGMEETASSTRMIACSIQPPRTQVANRPMLTPRTMPMTTAKPATAREARDPQMMRLRMSRPDWSVPIQWAASGSISLSRMLTASGS